MKTLITLTIGLFTSIAAIAAEPAPVKVEGKLSILTSSGNEVIFAINPTKEAYLPQDRKPKIDRLNLARYDQNSCAVKIAKIVQEWEKNGIQNAELRAAIDSYEAENKDPLKSNDKIRINAKFIHRTHGLAEDGSRRFPTRNSLSYFDLVMSYGEHGGELQVDATDKSFQEDYQLCDRNLKTESVIERMADRLRSKADDLVREREMRRKEEIRKKNLARLRDAELGDAVLPNIDAR